MEIGEMMKGNKIKTMLLSFMVIVLFSLSSYPAFGEDAGGAFDAITVDAAITPAVAKYIIKSIEESHSARSQGLIILLDTPGGLDLAMRDIIKEILNSPIPVIVFVHPSGARAASAGVMITMAAHVAAMTPGTNIGAAHPVAMGVGGKMDETMAKKIENDAVAYAVGIAEKKKRNAEWVEDAVRKSVSITAEEALGLHVIDIVAGNMTELLDKMDGKTIALPSGDVSFKSKGALINEKTMGLRERILTTLSDPNIAYLLLMIGLAGLYFEFAHPGAILPGVVGGISLILSFFAMQTLPVNYAGMLLILFGIILFIAEIKVVSHGMLTVAGIICLVLGSLMLFESPVPALRVSLRVMIPTIAIVSLFFVGVISLAVKAQMRKPSTGMEGMIGKEGKAITLIHGDGKVFIKGEVWNASSVDTIEEGESVKVIEVKGLHLKVEKTEGQ